MADTKISALSDGGNAQAADEFVVARSGANYRIDGASVAAAATSVGTLSSLTVSGNITASGGTANGITYLNASKVLTTNADFTYNGTKVVLGTNGSFESAFSGNGLVVSKTNVGAVNAIRSVSDTSNILLINDSASGFNNVDIYTAGSQRLRIDASGNLGLGVTPSAWLAGISVFEFGAKGGLAAASSDVNLIYNAYFDGASKYRNNDYASYYQQAAGQHRWFTAPSGTAGNTVSYTQAMTLDASGNLGVGTASPGGTSTNRQLTLVGTTAQITANNGTASLNLGINAVDLGYVEITGANPLAFYTNATERARITSGGYFKASDAGTYIGSTGAYHEFRQTATAQASVHVSNTAASPYGVRVDYTGAAPNGTDNWFLYCNDTGGLRAEIRSNGGLRNYQSNNADLSDARTKNSITPAASMWDKVAALEIVTYKYNDQTHDDVNLGVIAQQVETVEPVWVDPDGFGETPEGEEPLKTVYTKDITFAAIKALQEAMARIEALEARIEALEA